MAKCRTGRLTAGPRCFRPSLRYEARLKPRLMADPPFRDPIVRNCKPHDLSIIKFCEVIVNRSRVYCVLFLNDDLNKLRRNDFLMNRRDTLRLALWFFEFR